MRIATRRPLFALLPFAAVLVFFHVFSTLAHAAEAKPSMSLSGEPKYGPDFTHFDYVNPDAPKGGSLKLSSLGSYDSFNPFPPKGVSADGVGLVYDTLTVKSDDEPFTEYGLVAQSMEIAPDNSSIVFHLRPEARFHDGQPITAEDLVFTFNALMDKGSPLYKQYYGDVAKVEALDEHSARFTFSRTDNRELPLILGQLPVLPKHWWEGRDFGQGSLEPPLGSGPYKLKDFSPGRSVTYERVADYWAKDLPVNKGQYNFDIIRYDYYRDETVAMQAFISGEYDLREENVSKQWATAYVGPPFDKGEIVKEEIPHDIPQGLQGFAYNTRRPIFQDPRVRQALAYAFDFEWSNQNLFYGQYKRTKSYFSNSELASSGPPSPQELAILEPFKDQLPPEVFTTAYEPPSTAGPDGLRGNLRTAMQILQKAGWEVKDGVLTNKNSGLRMEFELLMSSPTMERVALPFQKNLERLGVKISLRVVDASQYVNRLRDYDFDMTTVVLPQSLSPGNEQRYYWGSQAADTPGTRNFMGIKNPAVDALLELVINAPDRQTLIERTRALDRALLWGFYVIPHFHSDYFRVAHWDKFERPKVSAPYALGLFTWWVKPGQGD